MRHGRFMGFGYNGSIIFILFIILAAIIFFFLMRDHFKKRNNKENDVILQMLEQRYIVGDIDSEEYRERCLILEDEDYMYTKDSSLLLLKEQYAKGEISSYEYCNKRNEMASKIAYRQ